ncbi:protein kinase [Nonomuraea sp. NPDC049709]|uniref:serine/threonine-protein kinase n=1 Tax=Nonomuraea sp. NPDC049709 TaxID=3154736 RepID=UPI003418873F
MPNVEPLREGDPAAVGPYRLVGRLGAGGHGVVYLGQARNGTPVAVKVLREGLAVGDRLAKEISAARKVEPFCLAQVLDASTSGRPYIVAEYVDGPSLQQAGRRGGAELQRLAVATATALDAIHQAGVVHGDFTPSNVLLGPDGARVVDFGIAAALSSGMKATSNIVGTPAYMAPEQLAGKPVGAAADVFAWASVLVYASTGVPPFGDDALPAVINRILHEEPRLGELGRPLRDIVPACLAKDPAARPSMRDVLLRLAAPARRSASPYAAPTQDQPAADTPESDWDTQDRTLDRPQSRPSPTAPGHAPTAPRPHPSGTAHTSGTANTSGTAHTSGTAQAPGTGQGTPARRTRDPHQDPAQSATRRRPPATHQSPAQDTSAAHPASAAPHHGRSGAHPAPGDPHRAPSRTTAPHHHPAAHPAAHPDPTPAHPHDDTTAHRSAGQDRRRHDHPAAHPGSHHDAAMAQRMPGEPGAPEGAGQVTSPLQALFDLSSPVEPQAAAPGSPDRTEARAATAVTATAVAQAAFPRDGAAFPPDGASFGRAGQEHPGAHDGNGPGQEHHVGSGAGQAPTRRSWGRRVRTVIIAGVSGVSVCALAGAIVWLTPTTPTPKTKTVAVVTGNPTSPAAGTPTPRRTRTARPTPQTEGTPSSVPDDGQAVATTPAAATDRLMLVYVRPGGTRNGECWAGGEVTLQALVRRTGSPVNFSYTWVIDGAAAGRSSAVISENGRRYLTSPRTLTSTGGTHSVTLRITSPVAVQRTITVTMCDQGTY